MINIFTIKDYFFRITDIGKHILKFKSASDIFSKIVCSFLE